MVAAFFLSVLCRDVELGQGDFLDLGGRCVLKFDLNNFGVMSRNDIRYKSQQSS